MTLNDLFRRVILIEADQSHMLGRIPNPTGYKTQSASTGIGFFKRDIKDEKARDYYKGGVLPKDVSRGSVSSPPEVKATYNLIRDALKIAASCESTNSQLASLFTTYMTEYELIWSLNMKVEEQIKYLQDTIKKVEKAAENGESAIKRKGANGSLFEVDGEEAIESCEENLREAEVELNNQIQLVVEEKRPTAYKIIIESIRAACKELYGSVKEKAAKFNTTVVKQLVSDYGESAEALFKVIIAFLSTDEVKRTGSGAFARYSEFIENRSENIIHNDVIKTLNEWYKNIILRYPKQSNTNLVSLKPGNKSIALTMPYQNLISKFKQYKDTEDSLPELIESISNTVAFTDHEKSVFADTIVSFYKGRGTEASVVRTIRDAGEQIAG